MKPLFFIFPGNEILGEKIVDETDGETASFILRQFPDGESYIRILTAVPGRKIYIVCTLHRPNDKLLPLLFLIQLLRELNVNSICLISSYLPYMRQDKQFHPGEAVSSKYFASLLSSYVDRIITIDPHLHRRSSLKEIYSIPCEIIHTRDLIAGWIIKNTKNALLIGPDSESEQWVSEVATKANVPYLISSKIRKGDHEVVVTIPQVENFLARTPVIVDDIISTAQTMIQTVISLNNSGMKPVICIGVHAVFAEDAYTDLQNTGAAIITCNTISHPSNQIDVSKLIAKYI
jgi:ribose-phosphate pyrophosphokinase